ncbi:MAG TPA: formylglycine-generating enzyme family protein [Limnobacter sp.]|nr:formylglycine-generating enzyme family protein [Limnobacter sp.]
MRIQLPGGQCQVGSNDHYPEERPVRMASVGPFAMDAHPVTRAQFAAFVKATGYVTTAEQQGSSHVFVKTEGPVVLNDPTQWWRPVAGASWQAPQLVLDEQCPVTHVSLQDAKAYAAWAGGRLPSEDEWEYAARGGLQGATYAWGDEFAPGGQRMAHVWRGSFPWYHSDMAQPAPVPVRQYPANGFGLYDMVGNVWEWTVSPYQRGVGACCTCSPTQDANALLTLKGGSYLCAAEYCLRYRPAARIGATPYTSTAHIGFRCVY